MEGGKLELYRGLKEEGRKILRWCWLLHRHLLSSYDDEYNDEDNDGDDDDDDDNLIDDTPCRAKGIAGLHEGGKVETVSYEKPGNMILTQGAEVCIFMVFLLLWNSAFFKDPTKKKSIFGLKKKVETVIYENPAI